MAWTLVAFGSTYPEYRSAREALDTGHYSVIAGQITNYAHLPFGVRGFEHFTVGSKTFTYWPIGATTGFNNQGSAGGMIRAGEYVRVSYVQDTIVRLEVAQ